MNAIRKSKGIKCKACDRPLNEDDFDGELCSTCLHVVLEINHELYNEEDDYVAYIEDEDDIADVL
jgi:hypothetical protein